MDPAWQRDLGDADPYLVLGVTRHADREEILKAFKRRARSLHPDVSGDDTAFKRLNLARDVLLDPRRRAEYDRLTYRPAAGTPVPYEEPPPAPGRTASPTGRPDWVGQPLARPSEPPDWVRRGSLDDPGAVGVPFGALVLAVVLPPLGALVGLVLCLRTRGPGRSLAAGAVGGGALLTLVYAWAALTIFN